jgi:regulator of sigma E protease
LFESPPLWMYALGFPLLLGPLVTLHELGHLLVGRLFGVKAEAFSVGFGKELAGFTDKHGTRWKLSALPLGGYVQFKGDMNPASVPDPGARAEEGSFQHAALWKRALIVAAGPVTNLLIAIAILAGFFAAFGQPVYSDTEASVTVASFSKGSTAEAAGMQIGDNIVSVDGAPTKTFEQLVDRIAFYPGQKVTIAVLRDGKPLELPVTIGRETMDDGFGNKGDKGLIGVGPAPHQLAYEWEPVPLLETVPLATERCWKMTVMMVTGIKQIVTGQRSIKELGGPIKIGKVAGERLSQGPVPFIEFAALISLNLAFINFLPIPALDGGHLMFYLAEAIRRKPVGPQATEWAYRTGIALVLMLMVVVTVNDIFSLPIFGS